MTKGLAIAAFCLCLVLSTDTFSQTTNATLGGTVTDSSGAFVPGVELTAKNTQTGIVTTTLTNESGSYQFPNLQTGTYSITAKLSGFQTQTYNDVVFVVAQQVLLHFSRPVGTVTTAVDVSVAVDTLLAPSSASVGTVLPDYKIRDLPLASRDVLDLVTISPGVEGDNFAGHRVNQVAT